MEKPFYEFDLTQYESLKEELNELYIFCKNEEIYKNLIYRGVDTEFFNGEHHIMKFDSYRNLVTTYKKVNEFISLNPNHQYAQLSLFAKDLSWESYPNIHKFILEKVYDVYADLIINKFPNFHSIKETKIGAPLPTMYKIGGFLSPHQDGKPIVPQEFTKPANILIYLNKNYKKEYGGCFVVDGIEVLPEYGKMVFLNFKNDSDPEHSVSIVKEDVNRIALLFNTTFSNTEKKIRKIL